MNSPFSTLTHFHALVLFALVVSVTFGFLSKQGAVERTKYIAWAFVMFLLVAMGIGWLMYPFSR
jgi:putative Mn2+ efflux pump MntP